MSFVLVCVFFTNSNAGKNIIELWILFCENLINRVETSIFMLENYEAILDDSKKLDENGISRGRDLLEKLREQKQKTDGFYSDIIKPSRRAEYMEWMFGTVEKAMERLLIDH